MTARSTAEARRLDPTAITCFRQADVGEYLREVDLQGVRKTLNTSSTDFWHRRTLYLPPDPKGGNFVLILSDLIPNVNVLCMGYMAYSVPILCITSVSSET